MLVGTAVMGVAVKKRLVANELDRVGVHRMPFAPIDRLSSAAGFAARVLATAEALRLRLVWKDCAEAAIRLVASRARVLRVDACQRHEKHY